MSRKSYLSFLLLYLSWVLILALMQFWMQSQADFIGVVMGNIFMIGFAILFMAGCFYFLRYFVGKKWYVIIFLMALWCLSYLLIEALSVLFLVTLDHEMILAIGMSSYEAKDILSRLWLDLPTQFIELITLQNATHLLDVFYATLIELAIFSPIVLLVIKKDCHKAHKCV